MLNQQPDDEVNYNSVMRPNTELMTSTTNLTMLNKINGTNGANTGTES